MDEKVTAVLDAFHERMAEERRNRLERRGPFVPPAADGQDPNMYPVGPRTGRLLNILAGSLEAPTILEIGTSYGYSAIWLAEAARSSGGRVITMEMHDYKVVHAREMVERAGLADHVEFMVGDAVAMIEALACRIDFVLLDLWKDLYVPCLEAFLPKLNPGAIVVADNMLYPGGDDVAAYGRAVRAKPGMTSVLLPVGSGLEISRYEP